MNIQAQSVNWLVGWLVGVGKRTRGLRTVQTERQDQNEHKRPFGWLWVGGIRGTEVHSVPANSVVLRTSVQCTTYIYISITKRQPTKQNKPTNDTNEPPK